MLVYEFKLKGNKVQYQAINEALRIVQFVRNKAVRHWMDTPGVNKYDLSKLAATLPKEFAFAAQLNSTARQQATERAWAAIARFYQNCKQKITGKKGYPKFQRANRSVEYKQSGWKLVDGCRRVQFTDKCGIGTLKLIGNQHLNQVQGKIQRVRIVKRADGYYVQFLLTIERQEVLLETGSHIGLDMGLLSWWTDSHGVKQEPLKAYRKAEWGLRKAQKRVCKRVKGSNNRKKAIRKLGRKHLKVQRQRKDFAIKAARALYQSHDVVVIEDLQVRNMVKNRRLAKSISDAGWYQLRLWLARFSQVFGKTLVIVPPNYTSVDCSGCRRRVVKALGERVHRCECGMVLDRDHNAALNILNKGLDLIGTVGHTGTRVITPKTPVESLTAA